MSTTSGPGAGRIERSVGAPPSPAAVDRAVGATIGAAGEPRAGTGHVLGRRYDVEDLEALAHRLVTGEQGD